MRMETANHLKPKLSQKALERKSNKPIMEKKRRARINHCLNQLKALILETDNERSRHSKLEKADILEMTVRYLQTLRAYHIHLQQLHAATLGSGLQIQQEQPTHQQILQQVRGAQIPSSLLQAANLSALTSPNHLLHQRHQQQQASPQQQPQPQHQTHHQPLTQIPHIPSNLYLYTHAYMDKRMCI